MGAIFRVLGIETSCDDCSLAIVENGQRCIAMHTHSQLREHAPYGGVVPELASRLHLQYISSLYHRLFRESSLSPTDIDGIAVTAGPGLSGSLMVGLHFAKALSLCLDIPFTTVDHIAAHFYSARLSDISQSSDIYPYVGAVISGGHTVFGIVSDFDTVEIRGHSIDDACGEAFDKVARELQLGNGADIDFLAQKGHSCAAHFPTYYRGPPHTFDVSYSGLKTAVIHHRDKYWNKKFPQNKENIAASFTRAAISMIVERVIALAQHGGIPRIYFGGGVCCNSYLRQQMSIHARDGMHIIFPPPELCVDNAAMVAGLGYEYLSRGMKSTYDVGVYSRTDKYKNTILSS